MRYLSLAEVLFLHRLVTEQSGQQAVPRDLGALESAIAQPRQTFGGEDLYPSLAGKAAALGFSLIQKDPFVDIRERHPDLPAQPEDRHPVELLFEKLSALEPYPEGVVPLWARIPGFSFFPGGAGLWDAKEGEPLPRFPTGGVMILGHNFYSVEGFEDQLQRRLTDDQYPTGRTLSRILDATGIPKSVCFFTNFFMGLSDGARNMGTFPGARDERFVERCRDLLRFQLQLQQPRLVLVLGLDVPSLVAAIAPALKPWDKCHTFRQIDEPGLAIVEGVEVDGVDSPFTAVVLAHPCLSGPNVRHRRFQGLEGKEAERELLRVAWDSTMTTPLKDILPDHRENIAETLAHPDVVRRSVHMTTARGGNWRVGHAAMVAFLRLNGRRLEATADEAEQAILQAASGVLDRAGLQAWIQAHEAPA